MRALACLFALTFAVLVTAPRNDASAQDRGYGGPATVGPNFSTGKQSEPPDYGTGQPKKQKNAVTPQAPKKKVAKPAPDAKKPSKPDSTAKQSDPPKTSPTEPAETKTEPTATAETTAKSTEPDTAGAPASQTNTAGGSTPPAAKPETCRRFDATTGTTLEVACE